MVDLESETTRRVLKCRHIYAYETNSTLRLQGPVDEDKAITCVRSTVYKHVRLNPCDILLEVVIA